AGFRLVLLPVYFFIFFFSSRRRHTRSKRDWSSDVCSSDLESVGSDSEMMVSVASGTLDMSINSQGPFSSYVPEASLIGLPFLFENAQHAYQVLDGDRKSTRLNSSHVSISYAVFCLKKKTREHCVQQQSSGSH